MTDDELREKVRTLIEVFGDKDVEDFFNELDISLEDVLIILYKRGHIDFPPFLDT